MAAEAHTYRRTRPATVEGRRLWAAGHALVIVVAALGMALLLNAPGVHKAAYGQPDGWKRDVTIAFTGPLADVSHALLVDRPRKLVQAVIGRSGEDEIDTAIVLPPTPPPAVTPPTKKPRRIAFTPERRLRLWLAGDSLVIVPAQSIVRAAGASPVIESVGSIEGRVATGLERPDVFNWFRAVRKRLKELRPHAVVLGFGGNDDHGYMTGLPEGVAIAGFGTESWRREYARRAGGLMDTITRTGAYVVWIGLPITRDGEQTQRYDIINAVVQREARKRARAVAFIDTYAMFASDTGGFTEYLPTASGGVQKVRAADGVHFERTGGDIIAREVLKRLNAVYDLTSWRKNG